MVSFMTTQIKASDIPRYRKMFAAKQKYKCPVCGGSLASGLTALDHSHTTGELRGTLCGPCNRAEGKVKVGAHYMMKITHLAKVNYLQWLKRLVAYLEYHTENPSGIIHPTFDLEKGKQKPRKRAGRKKK